METKILLLCVASMLLNGASGSCPIGTDFLTVFMTNYKPSTPSPSFQLAITSYRTQAKVKVEMTALTFSNTVAVPMGQTVWVSLPQSAELQGMGRSPKSVRITSDNQISVVAFNAKSLSGDSCVVFPTEELGTEYIIFTPNTGLSSMDKLATIINGKDPNQVEICPKVKMIIEGVERMPGKTVTISLAPYETYQLKSRCTFSGTRVRATSPVAVLAGHQCSLRSKYCNHIYEQLVPLQRFSTQFLVPAMNQSPSKDLVHVVAAEDNTMVKITADSKTQSRMLTTGDVWDVCMEDATPLAIESNKKVMVMYYSSGDQNDPFLTNVIPTEGFSNKWFVDTQQSFTSSAVVISEADGVRSILLNNRKLCSRIRWKNIGVGAKYVWTTIDLGSDQNHFELTSDSMLGVYVYGFKSYDAYGTTGVCYSVPAPTSPPDPCNTVKCREKEVCQNGVCKHISKATCRAVGDPHYTTFDGRSFDFQGTCTYTLVTCLDNDPRLIPFSVTAKNEHRGNTQVSFVRTVSISVYGHVITISKYDVGKVGVNSISTHLPVTLSDGKLRVVRSGGFALLQTDFDLQVMYDWNMALFIMAPSSYFRSLGGLCGNYNGNREDDFSTPKGALASSVLDFASSWKAEDKDVFCHHDCKGQCPSCSMVLQEKYRGEAFCGLMAKTDGPFAGCHQILDPGLFVDNCVYDVCINKGYKKFFCEAIESYAGSCQREGAKVANNWRVLASCPLYCPEYSHYENCGNACPASCSDIDAPSKCKMPCAETCQCNPDYVLSGTKCVPKESCGCTLEGQYYMSGQEFWADDKCNKKCTCQAKTGKVECVSMTCKNSEVCDLRKGIRGCYPASYGTCVATGDPHYRTFDGKAFDFQGTCTYQMSKLCNPTPGLVPYEVHVQNENRGRNKAVSFTKMVKISIYGHEIIMSKDNSGKVLFNNVFVSLPFYFEDNKVSIYRSGLQGVLKTDFGLTVSFNWVSYVSISLPSTYSGSVCGLCGNWNGNQNDDMLAPDKSLSSTPAIFGESWKVKDVPGCSSDCKGTCPICDLKLRGQYEGKALCGIISNPDGPFKGCHGKVDPKLHFDNCLFDLCLYRGHVSALCAALTAYMAVCHDARAEVAIWRSDTFCPASCKQNSHYEVNATGCPVTCRDLSEAQSCDSTLSKEGCVCNDGFVLSDSNCVPVAECGCVWGSQYYKTDEVFFPMGLCLQRCVCQEGGKVECDDSFSCGPNEKCQLKDGIQGCHPMGTGSCWISGNSRYRSFDGRSFSLRGNCTYMVASVTEGNNKLIPFKIMVNQETELGITVTMSFMLEVYGYRLAMLPGYVWQIRVDGINTNLPAMLEDGKVSVYQSGIHIILETDFGLRVSYDSSSNTFVSIPSTYKGMLGGLCGNYNDNQGDDFALPDGKQTADVDTFAAGWGVLVSSVMCQTGCGSQCPASNQQKKPDAESDVVCGKLISKSGPFSGCHATVLPREYFEECVQEMITEGGNEEVLCSHLQHYVAACQAAGATVSSWRTEQLCPVMCPINSHYELCADTCTSTCASLSLSIKCRNCQEGCQCNEGFVSNGDACVPLESCGCTVNGIYYKSGENVVQNDCSQACSCKAGVFSCSPNACSTDEICEIRDGAMGCYSKDPCLNTMCRKKEECIVRDRNAVCVATSKVTCWAMGDPHYQSFDGLPFSFQGTCTYTLSQTTGKDPTLTPFSIISKNEVRGNSEGSFVKSITIKIKDHEISIHRGESGSVRIDGISSHLPVRLESEGIRIMQSGIRAVVQTDYGLEIVFDWTTLFMVTVSSSYYDNLAGLCGTYNEDKKDDLQTPAGSLVGNMTEWAKSWSVPDRDPFCWHYCKGYCPTCSDEDTALYRSQKYCGLLEDKKGPFSECHKAVAPQIITDNCLYDVCLNKGRQEVYCQALANYVATCREAGSSVSPQWRELSGCPLNCPENSHYKFCANPCPATCSNPTGRHCELPCTEGCECEEGFVYSGNKCVSRKTGCGCNYKDHYYMPMETFWTDSNCQELCTCEESTQWVSCQMRGCKDGEKCMVVDGIQDCYPISYKTCSAMGDPHFLSFDGLQFDFQGSCVYRLVGVCSKDPSLQTFDVSLENNNRGSPRVSFAKVVTVKVFDSSITISNDYRGKILVNGILTSLPYYMNNSQGQAYRSGRFGVLETHFGLQVMFDWNSEVKVRVPSSYTNATCGLCGNYNGDKKDDLLMPNGQKANNPTQFGNSYKVGDALGCSSECKDCAQTPPTPAPGEKPPPYVADCDVITDPKGPLGDCLGKVDYARFHGSCMFDIQLNKGLQKAACDAIAAYVEQCQDAGGQINTWRKKDFCALSCPKNSEYSTCAPGCPATCYSMSAPTGCKAACREGCQCMPGFLLSDEECVPIQECGCKHENRYYRSGQIFYTDGDCQLRCSCQSGIVACQVASCGPQEMCSVLDGVQRCHPKAYSTCSVSGHSHHLTFDKLSYDFQGACSYTLVTVSNSAAVNLPWFSVFAEKEHVMVGKVSTTRSITVRVFGVSITLEKGFPWQIQMNGTRVNLPFSLDGGILQASQAGMGIVVQANFGLRVTYDLWQTVLVKVPSTYSGVIGGLCGNYNNQKDDEFALPLGGLVGSANEFGISWRMEGEKELCGDFCLQGGCPKPGDKEREELTKSDRCGLISAPNGPLAACHPVLPPAGFLENCIADSFTAGGKTEAVCLGIQAYVTACQEAGVTLKDWRSRSFCPFSCPANSHYSLCADTCHNNCMGITNPQLCSKDCSEGCECDTGFVADGDKCVEIQDCGCEVDGMYLKSGEIIYMNMCTQKCSCSSRHNSVCEETSCPANTQCAVRNGALGCYPTHVTCILTKGSVVESFDGMVTNLRIGGHFDVVVHPAGKQAGDSSFRVVAGIQACGQDKSTLGLVFAFFAETLVTVSAKQKVWVNGQPVSLPWKATNGLAVSVVEGAVVMEKDGKEVHLSSMGDLSVTVPNLLMGGLKGLCGTYNNEAKDDLRTKENFLTAATAEFIKSWISEDFLPQCD
ncbi:IgGFc-binding protein isoform X4 [Amia ocellicauda]|uniref:IgGFc-binding protein isoform X3 n=1 Tax=Amia ocellicauda TaxID=2972642 RepID=UPI00346474BC